MPIHRRLRQIPRVSAKPTKPSSRQGASLRRDRVLPCRRVRSTRAAMKSRRLSSVAVRPLTETNRRSCTSEQPSASGLRQRRLDDVPAVGDARVTASNCPRDPGSSRRRGRQTQGAVSPGYFAYLRSAPRWVYPDGVHRISVPSARLPGLSRSPCDPLNFREVIWSALTGTNSARWSRHGLGACNDSRIEPGEKVKALCPACCEIGGVVV
jgi:hypothetical protein